jgi:hypothetical protein
MTALYRDGSAAPYYTNPIVTLTKPTGVVSGDVMLASFVTNDGTRVLNTLPDGWSTIASVASTTAPGIAFWVCKKVAGGSEPATYDFEFNYGFNGRALITAYQDGSDASVAGVAASAALGTSPYAVSAAAITVPDADSKILFFGAARFTTTGTTPVFTPPSGYDERIDSGLDYDSRALTLADVTQASAGSSGAVAGSVANATGGDARTVGVLIAIAPVGGSSEIAASGEGDFPVISAVVISSAGEAVQAGNYADVLVTVREQTGVGQAGLTGTISSTDTGVATVSQLEATDANGQAVIRILGVATGSCTISATFDGVTSNLIPVTVSLSSTATVAVTPATAALAAGATQQFTAALDGDPSATFVWSISSGAGSISAGGLFTATTPGTIVARATYSGDAGLYGEATITVSGGATATPSGPPPARRNRRRFK